ncbi:dimethylsulfonioproprionate lyase family protein [Donghicola mangrovi]|uniref:Transcriptional regulator n=1 Tax=Donghicola mangrovi TaxID=2729614 RepID=A0A850QE40_9RHOB|nr:dimethylsulfonioproprionate lyase family protein [Donghicola mangrovi]NVO24685.1 transcriptional regulator [Donghicola mangrovi]
MTTRDSALQSFVDAAEAAFRHYAQDDASRVSIDSCFAALREVAPIGDQAGHRLPVCDEWLPQVIQPDTLPVPLRPLAQTFLAIEPQIHWRPRTGDTTNASENFAQGHANAMILGPGGIEPRTDVLLGASLLAPHVRYPDHTHPPEETYLVLTDGDFSQNDGPWFTPGVGGSFHNTPGILHAMRSGESLLFAFWLLRAKDI